MDRRQKPENAILPSAFARDVENRIGLSFLERLVADAGDLTVKAATCAPQAALGHLSPGAPSILIRPVAIP